MEPKEMDKDNTKKLSNNYWNRLWAKFRSLDVGKVQDKKDESESGESSKKETDVYDEIGKEYLNAIKEFKEQTNLNVDSDKLTNAINNFQRFESISFESKGFRDGGIGVKNHGFEASAEARALFIVEHSKSILEGKYKGLIESKLVLEHSIESVQEEIKEEKYFNSQLTELRRTAHRHFSLFTAWFYFLIGILVMFADFPISIGIAKHYVDLPIAFEDTFANKVTNPEVVLFALGITFLSIYFKIMYDEYINKGLLKRSGKNIEAPSIVQVGNGIGKTLRFIFQIIILLGIIYLLYSFGNVRNGLNELPIEPLYPTLVGIDSIFNYKLWSFIGSTILLPLVSGICLSLGLTTFSNRRNYNESNLMLEKLNDKMMVLQKDLTLIQNSLATLSQLKEDYKNNTDRVASLTKLFTNSYFQGYRIGHRIKYGNDIYENALAIYVDEMNKAS